MKTISFITLLLSVTLFTISAYTNSPVFGAISVIGMIIALTTFIDAFYFQKKSKKSY
jgi:hypothetical protein